VNSDFSTTVVTDSAFSDLETTDAGAIMVHSTTGLIAVNDGDGDGAGILAGTNGDVLLEASRETALNLAPTPMPVLVDGSFFMIERQFAGAALETAVFEYDNDGTRSIPGSFLLTTNSPDEIVDQIRVADIGLFPKHLGLGVIYLGDQSQLCVDVQAPNLHLVTQPGLAGDVALAADLSSGGGHISVAASDDVLQSGDIITGDAGTVSVTAVAGEIAMGAGTMTGSIRGPITYRAAADVALGVLTSTEGAIDVTADNDGDNAGSINDATAAEEPNLVTNAMVSLTASSGIGGVGDADIDTMIGMLEVTNRRSGDVAVQEANGLIVSGSGLRTPSGRMNLAVDAGDLKIDSIITMDAATPSGQIALTAVRGSIVLENTARLATGGGSLSLDAGLAITMVNGSLVDANGGAVDLTAEYGVLLSRIVSPGATVTVDAGQGGIADGVDPADPPEPDGADIEAARAELSAKGSIGTRIDNTPFGTVTIRLDTKINSLAAQSDGVGIFLVNEGPLDIVEAVVRTDSPPGIVDVVVRSETFLTEGESQVEPPGRFDVNGDGVATPLDALQIINALNSRASRTIDPFFAELARLDVNGDATVSPLDALQIINFLNLNATKIG
jgi:hypothetical protein